MTKGSRDLLSTKTVTEYLINSGLLKSGINCVAIELSGGVSNTVLKVDFGTRAWIIKQALPQLKVAEVWQVDQRRAIVEAHAISYFHELNPKNVPELIYLDPENYVVIMEEVSKGGSVWKTDLLNEIFEPAVAFHLGAILANWHKTGINDQRVRNEFNETSLFEQLRIDPFYRYVALHNPDLQEIIKTATLDLELNISTVVHGDFSPKNIMVSPQTEVFILDFEVTHLGNPVFDNAFLAAHLLCKYFRAVTDSSARKIEQLYLTFAASYEDINATPATLPLHTALIALARIEGKSPVNYLNERQQVNLSSHLKKLLKSGPNFAMTELFEMGAR